MFRFFLAIFLFCHSVALCHTACRGDLRKGEPNGREMELDEPITTFRCPWSMNSVPANQFAVYYADDFKGRKKKKTKEAKGQRKQVAVCVTKS